MTWKDLHRRLIIVLVAYGSLCAKLKNTQCDYIIYVTLVACICHTGAHWSREIYLDDRFQHTAPHLPWYAANVKSERSCERLNLTKSCHVVHQKSTKIFWLNEMKLLFFQDFAL